MKFKSPLLIAGLTACGLTLGSATAFADDDVYQVTITNLTRSQSFTPILIASHRNGISLFEAGRAASDELAALAEGGDVAPMTALLQANHKVREVTNSAGL